MVIGRQLFSSSVCTGVPVPRKADNVMAVTGCIGRVYRRQGAVIPPDSGRNIVPNIRSNNCLQILRTSALPLYINYYVYSCKGQICIAIICNWLFCLLGSFVLDSPPLAFNTDVSSFLAVLKAEKAEI